MLHGNRKVAWGWSYCGYILYFHHHCHSEPGNKSSYLSKCFSFHGKEVEITLYWGVHNVWMSKYEVVLMDVTTCFGVSFSSNVHHTWQLTAVHSRTLKVGKIRGVLVCFMCVEHSVLFEITSYLAVLHRTTSSIDWFRWNYDVKKYFTMAAA